MKLLVFAHRLELGGTQVNAIELAARMRDRHGAEVIVHATEGPALGLLRDKGLRFRPAPDARFHPAPARIRALAALVRDEAPDLIHAWDWWQGLEAVAGAHLPRGTPLVVSDMMMRLTRALPREVPVTFGVADLVAQARREGWRRPRFLPPPVDIEANAPGLTDPAPFRRAVGAGPDTLLLVAVSRLSTFMKLEGLVTAIQTMRRLGADLPATLVIVGDGAERSALTALAASVNRDLGRDAVRVVGPMDDPRPAYAAADVVLGMGGSALRGLAHGKPVVVLGELGFARLFTRHASREFLNTGIYGRGLADDLEATIRDLALRPELRDELGRFGRDFVARHHGLDRVSDDLARVFDEAIRLRLSGAARIRDAARAFGWYLRERRFRVASRDPLRRVARPGAQPGAVAP